ncbi:MAG: hypothetical protein FD124_1577 [Alphaproteobacteria bacterium]|nr:MAG: hypothetical protein FD124_1577 [Alphaproteobacteria bacterium]
MGPHSHMKHQQRQRGRGRKPGGGGGSGGGGHQSNRAFESNGPDIKVRGSASTVYEKYLQLARDANSSGDRVMAESYLQHAEHYYRVLRAMQPAHQPAPEQRYDQQQRFGHDPDLDYDENGDEYEAGAEQQPREGGEQPGPEAREDARPPQQAYREDRGPRNDGPRSEGPRGEGDRPDGERGPRLEGESTEAYEAREPREDRAPRDERPPQQAREPREPREERAPREAREPRAEGDERPPRRERAPRPAVAEPVEGFADSPKPAFLAGD